ncbi:MAG: zinc-binding dehydrogenase [Phycisphaerae bacterium]
MQTEQKHLKTGNGRPGLMRAARVTAPGRIELVEVPMPEPGPGQVRVRLEGCGVCASNVPPFEGRDWFTYPMPAGALGHESWGRVEAVGPGVMHFAEGDRVATLAQDAYADCALADESQAVRLPQDLAAVPFPAEPLACAMNVFARSGIRSGDTVAVVGCGFLGALLCRLAAEAEAAVIALSRRDFPLQLASLMGADHTIRMDDHFRIIEEVKQLTDGRLCDVVIEATGKQWPLQLAGELCRERGRLVIAGFHQDGMREVNMQTWNWRGLDVTNAHERDPAVYVRGMRRAVTASSQGRLDVEPLLTHHVPLENLAEALTMTRDRPDGFLKAVVRNQPPEA